MSTGRTPAPPQWGGFPTCKATPPGWGLADFKAAPLQWGGTGATPMKLGLINSAWVQAGKGTAYGIRMTKEIGFDSIDVFADPLDLDARERKLIRRECEKAGLPIVSIACVAVGLIDFNPSVQRFHLERCRKYLDLVYELEAKNLLLVVGEYIWEKAVI